MIGLFERTLSRIQQTGTHRNRLRPSRPRDASRSPIDPLLTLDDGLEAHVVFVVQRPDVNRFRPYREVDHEFAALLAEVRAAGVGVHAVATAFEPPHYRLWAPALPVGVP